MPSQDEGTRRGQRPQEWWLSSEERQGQPLLMGADSQYWKSADWVIFQTRLETARPEVPEAWLPRHQKRMGKDPTADWPWLLQRMLREPSHSDAAVIAEHETQVKPVSEGKGRMSREL